jgi:hypothetical protein
MAASNQTEQLRVEVRLRTDPPLWQWEIRKASAGTIGRSSWQQEWTAYASADETWRAGGEQWQGLRRSSSRDSSSASDENRSQASSRQVSEAVSGDLARREKPLPG